MRTPVYFLKPCVSVATLISAFACVSIVMAEPLLIEENPPSLNVKRKYNQLAKMPINDKYVEALIREFDNKSFVAWLDNQAEHKTFLIDKMIRGRAVSQDSEFIEFLDSTGLKYQIKNIPMDSEETDFKVAVTFGMDNDGRTQEVWSESKTSTVGNYRLRQIYSMAYNSESTPPDKVLVDALEKR